MVKTVFPRRRERPSAAGSEEGFSLAEVIVAMSIVVVVCLASAPFFYKASQSTHGAGLRETAISLINQRLDLIRGLDATTLLNGRTQASVNTLLAAPTLVDLSQDNTTGANSDYNYDPNATNSSVPVVPTSVTEAINKTSFVVRTYIDPCYRPKAGGACVSDPTKGIRILRVSADVSWPKLKNANCSSAIVNFCEYFATTLIDPTLKDPVFNLNLSPPTVSKTTMTTPTTLYVGQTGTIAMQGTNFIQGATMTSNDATDSFSATYGNTGVAANANVTVGDVGTRVFRMQNPDGTSAVSSTAPTGITVGLSSPTVTSPGGVTSSSMSKGASSTITIKGSGFYGSGLTNSTPPTVTITETTASGPVTLTPSNVTLSGTTTITATVTLAPAAGTALNVTVTNYDGQPASGSLSATFS